MSTQTDTRVQEDVFVCEADDCDKTFQSAGGRGSHMARVHGVKGTSRQAKTNRRRNQTKSKAKKQTKPHDAPKTTLIVAEGEFGVDGMLQAFFPDGIPQEKIPVVLKWVEVTRELMA